MNETVKKKVSELKSKYEAEGFIILGVFGSYARGEETTDSDVDILFDTTEDFTNKYNGFDYFGRLDKIRTELKVAFGKEVDLAYRNGLNRIGKKYILPEVVYV